MRRLLFIFSAALILAGSFLNAVWAMNPKPDMQKVRVPIMEYHHIDPAGSRWGRSVQQFKDDLLWFYNNGYALMSMEDFTDSDFSKIPSGKKPMVLTFDDGLISQFNYLPDGTIDPNCAIGILDEFYKQHPDFGRTTMFYVNAVPFGQPDLVQKKIKYLYDTGRQIGYHTLLHTNMKKLDAKSVRQLFIDQNKVLQPFLPQGMRLDSMAYPYGSVPRSGTASLQSGGDSGVHYDIRSAVLVGADPAKPLNVPSVDPFRIPRIQGIDSEFLRHFGRSAGVTAQGTAHEDFVPYVAGAAPNMPTQQIVQTQQRLTQQFSQTQQTFQTQQAELPAIPFERTYEGFTATRLPMVVRTVLSKNFWQNISKSPVPEKAYRRLRIMAMKAKIPDYKGIYLTAYSAGAREGQILMKKLKDAGGSLIVFDMKETDGHLYYPTTNDLNKKAGGNDRILFADPKKFVEEGKQLGFHMVARIVCFKDQLMAVKKPEWAIHDFKGKIWKSPEGQEWLDPSLPEVQDYIISIAKEAAGFGVDEVQFDYVRFPTQGNVGNANYSFDEKKVQHYEIIRDFLKKARRELAPLGVKIGVDIFGVVVWNNQYDSGSTGQKVGELAPYIDVVYPMLYPSHFGPGFDGVKNPGDDPYFFVHESARLFQGLVADYPVIVRPWLQAFPYRVSHYNEDYVRQQVTAAHDQNVNTFVLWNAGNDYETAWKVFAP